MTLVILAEGFSGIGQSVCEIFPANPDDVDLVIFGMNPGTSRGTIVSRKGPDCLSKTPSTASSSSEINMRHQWSEGEVANPALQE